MKRILSYLLIATLSIWSVLSYADVTVKKDLQGQPLGRYEIIRFITGGSNCTPTGCTGGSGQVYSNLTGTVASGASGETIVVDLTNLTGVNWNSINALGQTINWTGAQISYSGINWQGLPYITLPAASINWYQLGAPTGINWTGSYITNSGVNWNDVQASQQTQGLTTGINWNDINPVAGGINWMIVTHAAADNTLLCVKNGQPGRCTAAFSSTGAGSCQCQ